MSSGIYTVWFLKNIEYHCLVNCLVLLIIRLFRFSFQKHVHTVIFPSFKKTKQIKTNFIKKEINCAFRKYLESSNQMLNIQRDQM